MPRFVKEKTAAQATVLVVKAIGDTIREMHEETGQPVPLGPVYAACTRFGISYNTFTMMVGTLENAGLIRTRGSHTTAIWTGPALAARKAA
jgi:predicted transcriptional regulator